MKRTNHQEQINDAIDAAKIAKDVATNAATVAQAVVDKAEKTAEKVLLFAQTMEYIQKDIAEIKEKLDNKYVTKEEFNTVKIIVYGMISIIVIGVLAAIVISVIPNFQLK
jgi:F0F1-type ATP synthase gamma subunit